jgi:site-specific DNA-methyltransferase (adenine-specific)
VTKVVIGDAELWLGDCREVLPTLPAESVDMVWTDPPYGHNNASADFLSRRGDILGDWLATKAEQIANDDANSMREVVDAALTEAARILKADCCCCCCCCGGGPRPTFAWLAERLDRGGLAFFHSVIWDKKNPGIGWRYRRQHEMIMVAHRKGGKLSWAEGATAASNIVSISKPRDDAHPNIKPLGLIRQFIQRHTESGQSVLDPFMGSGTTGVACANLGRKFIGIEIEERYFQIACERIEAAYAQQRLFA